jgi:hypothetical protein
MSVPEFIKQMRKDRMPATGKVVLKRTGKYVAFHVHGERKTGVETFLKRKVLAPLGAAATIVPLCPDVAKEEPVATEKVSETEMRERSTYQKGLRGFKNGKYIHKQIVKMIRDAMPTFIEQRVKQEGKNKGQRGRRKRGIDVHPQLRAVCRMLNRCGYIPIDGDVGVHIGDFATQLDLVCYQKDGPKNEVTIFEIKTGYNKLREYFRPQYRVAMLPAPAKGAVFGASERDKHMLQLMTSTVQAAETFKDKWIIKDSILLHSRPDRAEMYRVPDPILKLNKHLLIKLRAGR